MLLTARHHRPPLTVVVFDGSTFGMVDLEMVVEGYPAHGTDQGNVVSPQIARAAGLDAIRVTEPSGFAPGSRSARITEANRQLRGFPLT